MTPLALQAPLCCAFSAALPNHQNMAETGPIAPPAPAPAPSGVRDGIDAVIQDHARIKSLFAEYRAAQSSEDKLRVSRCIVSAISQHASAEERLIYPQITSRMPSGATNKLLYDMMVMDDQINKEFLQFVHTHVPSTEHEWQLFDRQLGKFMAVEEEHLNKEEELVLAPLAELLSEEERMDLAAEWEATLRTAPMHPYPHTGGTTALHAQVMHPIAGVIDKATHMVSGLIQKVTHPSTESKAIHEGFEQGRHT